MALLRRLGRDYDAVATVKKGTLLFTPIGKGATPGGTAFGIAALARDRDTMRHSYRTVDRDQDGGVEAVWHDQDTARRHTVQQGTHARSTPKRLRRVYATEADARAAVAAEHARTLRQEFTLDLDLALGRPDLFPERQVALTGWKPEIVAHDWLIAEATHSLDGRGGIATRLRLETPGASTE